MSLTGLIIRFFVEQRAASTSLDDLRAQLAAAADEIGGRIEKAANTPANRSQAGHIIGIERWGDRRLRVALGEPFLRDDYDAYRPDPGLGLPALAQEFRHTRAETIALLDRLHPVTEQHVVHNDLGEISVTAWLVYLHAHANRESKALK
jgi:hypothetical protein